MEGNRPLITASKLWQGFCPVSAPLHYSVVRRETYSDVSFSYATFTALEAEDGKVRASVVIAESKKPATAPRPAILYLADYSTVASQMMMLNFASRGYVVFALNYSGQCADEEFYTTFPDSLSYGDFKNAGDRLDTANHGADGTCGFLWARIARRAITLIESYPHIDLAQINLLANKRGANVGWMVAGTDDRIAGFVPTFLAHEHVPVEITQSKERDQWMMACTIGAYARAVKCPVLFAGSTNSRFTAFEKLSDSFSVLPKSTFRAATITPLTAKKLSYASLNTIDKFLSSPANFVAAPDFKAVAIPKGISIKGSILRDDNIKRVSAYHAAQNVSPRFRNWARTSIEIRDSGNFSEEIVIHSPQHMLVYLEVEYKDNSITATFPKLVLNPDADEPVTKKVKRTNIIYERKSGTTGFVAENKHAQMFLEDNCMFVAKGPDELFGITASEGDLSTYTFADPRCRGQEGDLLRFDVASDTIRELVIMLHAEENGQISNHYANVPLTAGVWQKFTLAASDFKTREGIPLASWKHVKKTTFRDAAGIYLNNILWV